MNEAREKAWQESATYYRDCDGTGMNRPYSVQEAWNDGWSSRDAEVEALREALKEAHSNMCDWRVYVAKTSTLIHLYQKDLDKIEAALSSGTQGEGDG